MAPIYGEVYPDRFINPPEYGYFLSLCAFDYFEYDEMMNGPIVQDSNIDDISKVQLPKIIQACLNGEIIDSNNDISVYPNPNEDLFEIASSQKGSFYIVNTYGEKFIEGDLDYYTRVDLSNMPSGIYIVTMLCNEQKSIRKIIKM